MLAYAAHRPVSAKAPSSPSAMLLIISAHVALIALIMSAKMEIVDRHPKDGPLINVPIDPPPPPNPIANAPQHPRTPQPISANPNVPLPHPDPVQLDPPTDSGVLVGGSAAANFPQFPTQLIPTPVRHGPRLVTPPDELRPPYPESKILSGEEGLLTLRLAIDERGRVTDVQPVGKADAVFLAAARRYLIAHWRYQPATEGDAPVASTQVITLHFQLDG